MGLLRGSIDLLDCGMMTFEFGKVFIVLTVSTNPFKVFNGVSCR